MPMGEANGEKGCITELLLLSPNTLLIAPRLAPHPPSNLFAKARSTILVLVSNAVGSGPALPTSTVTVVVAWFKMPHKKDQSGPREICLQYVVVFAIPIMTLHCKAKKYSPGIELPLK